MDFFYRADHYAGFALLEIFRFDEVFFETFGVSRGREGPFTVEDEDVEDVFVNGFFIFYEMIYEGVGRVFSLRSVVNGFKAFVDEAVGTEVGGAVYFIVKG